MFGIMHMDPLQGTFAVGFGFYIGYLVEKAGSIRPAMVCHAVNNSAQVLLGWLSPATDQEPSQIGRRHRGDHRARGAPAVHPLCLLPGPSATESAEPPSLDPLPDLTPLPA